MAAISSLSPLVIVTDPGEDIDDTLTLALAARSQQFSKVIVISTNETLTIDGVGQVACYARKVLDTLGREDIPVYQGAESKIGARLLVKLDPSELTKQSTEYVEAVQALLKTSEKVHILGIGGMTVIHELIEACGAEKFVVHQMGGRISDQRKPEYNIRCDPKAAQAVLASGVDLRFTTSDTTFQDPMRMDESSALYQLMERKRGSHPFFTLLGEGFDAFRKAIHCFPYTSDALAFTGDQFCTFSRQKISISDEGFMTLDPKGVEVELSDNTVNTDRFLTHLQDNLDVAHHLLPK